MFQVKHLLVLFPSTKFFFLRQKQGKTVYETIFFLSVVSGFLVVWVECGLSWGWWVSLSWPHRGLS